MRYVGFDLETTGVDPFTDVPVQAAFVERVPSPQGYENRHLQLLINPGRPIGEASAIHGITDEMVKDADPLGPSVRAIRGHLEMLWGGGVVIVGMNVSYDLTMVNACLLRLRERPLRVGRVLDVLVIDRAMDKWRKGPRKLGALYQHYLGRELENAHGAAVDALAALEVLAAQGERWPFLEKVAYDPNATLAGWYRSWAEGFSEYLVRKGEPAFEPGRLNWPVHTNDATGATLAL